MQVRLLASVFLQSTCTAPKIEIFTLIPQSAHGSKAQNCSWFIYATDAHQGQYKKKEIGSIHAQTPLSLCSWIKLKTHSRRHWDWKSKKGFSSAPHPADCLFSEQGRRMHVNKPVHIPPQFNALPLKHMRWLVLKGERVNFLSRDVKRLIYVFVQGERGADWA